MTHGSLFHGAGLMAMGLEQAGFETKWTLELMDGQDITTEDPGRYERVDLVSGGPPCVHTSQAAALSRKRTLASMWCEMLRFVKQISPNWVVLEQPLGGVEIITEAAEDLQCLGYGCSGRVVDSRHWVPQQRSRWFLVGRLGIDGLALWHYLFTESQRGSNQRLETERLSRRFVGPCSECMRVGVSSRDTSSKFARVGAGNGVTVPVAKWLGERIIQAEREINERPFRPRAWPKARRHHVHR